MFFVGQPFRVAYSKAEALPYVNLFFAFTMKYEKKQKNFFFLFTKKKKCNSSQRKG